MECSGFNGKQDSLEHFQDVNHNNFADNSRVPSTKREIIFPSAVLTWDGFYKAILGDDLKRLCYMTVDALGSIQVTSQVCSDFKEFKGGYVAFGNDSKGGRISGKGTIKTSCLDFEKVSYVEELKFNLLSVSQICDKKHNVLFTAKDVLSFSKIQVEPKEKFSQGLRNESGVEANGMKNCFTFKLQEVMGCYWSLPEGHRGQEEDGFQKCIFVMATFQKRYYVKLPPGFEDPGSSKHVYQSCKATYMACIKPQEHVMQSNGGIVLRSMIGCLMYLTASRPDIMFAVCLCARFQVTPKVSHLHAVKRIFRYLKHQPNLGLWYPKDSPFHLEAFSDSDYAGDNHDRRSTSGGCQYLGPEKRKAVSWQCKKQTIVAYSSTEAEYVSSCKLL
ncbi:hypothetical protein Tco_0248313 [Tanacetum coccineum]